jgi:hypothetical protein
MLGWSIIEKTLPPTMTSEGLKSASEKLAEQLQQQLKAYADRREKKFNPQPASREHMTDLVPPQPQGPVLRPVP